MANALVENFTKGFGAGSKIGKARAQYKAGAAMADLHSFDPGAEPQEAPPQQGWNLGGEDTSMTAGMPGQEEQQPAPEGEGNTKLPSTRDWISLRAEALQAASKLGPDALADAHDQIDNIQYKGFSQNLLTARGLIEQGRMDEASQYLERGASFKPDFNVLVTSPAKMQDGSTQIAGMYNDEMTGDQKAPGMMLTTNVIDGMLRMYNDPHKFVAGNWDRKMAEQKAGLAERRFQTGRQDKSWERNWKVDKHRQTREDKQRYTRKDYNTAAKDAIDAFDETDTPLTAPQQLFLRKKLAAAASNSKLAGYSPQELAELAVEKIIAAGGE